MKKTKKPLGDASVQKTEGGETVTVSMNVIINVPEKIMLAEVLQSAIITRIQDAALPISPGAHNMKVLITLTK